MILCGVLNSAVSIKSGMGTADHGLWTGYKGLKCRLRASLVKTVLIGSRLCKIRLKDC